MCVLFYATTVVINLYIPRLAQAKSKQKWFSRQLILDFIGLFKTLWCDQAGQFSLIGTSLFWGVGVTLYFLLVFWVSVVFTIANNTTPILLNVVVAMCIIIGAGFTAHFITLNKVNRCMSVGIFNWSGNYYFVNVTTSFSDLFDLYYFRCSRWFIYCSA